MNKTIRNFLKAPFASQAVENNRAWCVHTEGRGFSLTTLILYGHSVYKCLELGFSFTWTPQEDSYWWSKRREWRDRG